MRRWGESESKFLKVGDLLNEDGRTYRQVAATIDRVTLEKMNADDAEPCYILWYVGGKKGHKTNKTLEEFLSHHFGDPPGSDPASLTQWLRGKRVGLYVDETVQYQGKRVGGVRMTMLPDRPAVETRAEDMLGSQDAHPRPMGVPDEPPPPDQEWSSSSPEPGDDIPF